MIMLTFAITGVICLILLGEAVLWKLLVRRLGPKRDLVDEDITRSGLFSMKRISVAALCHTVALGAVTLLPLVLLW